MNPILKKDATAMAEMVKSGEITPLELTNIAIEAIETLNPQLNAVITPMFEMARERAKGSLPDGPFKGVPMVLKDGIATYAGVPTSSGSNLFKGLKATQDSELVKRFKAAGFIILGKTNMPEFGMLPTTENQAFGTTKNPWNLSKTPGGSSGGTAAAVSSGMVPLGHANDGGGSIRIPASCCGLYGLKPTRGRNPLGPEFSEMVSGLVEEHVLTRSVRDSAAVLDATGYPDPMAFYHAPKPENSFLSSVDAPFRKLKIGVCTTKPMGGAVHQDCVDATLFTAKLCEKLGHEIVDMPLNLPFDGSRLGAIFGALWGVGTTGAMAFMDKFSPNGLDTTKVEPLSLAMYETSKSITGSEYESARVNMHKVARAVLAATNDVDIWLSPSLGMPPVDLGIMAQNAEDPMAPMNFGAGFSPMTALFNISGQPAASIPTYVNAEGLPVGVQAVGRYGDEATIISLSAQLERELQWEAIAALKA